MWFWWFIFVCDLLIPIIMIIVGNMMWLCTIQCLVLVLAIFPTEQALKRTFTDEGVRR